MERVKFGKNTNWNRPISMAAYRPMIRGLLHVYPTNRRRPPFDQCAPPHYARRSIRYARRLIMRAGSLDMRAGSLDMRAASLDMRAVSLCAPAHYPRRSMTHPNRRRLSGNTWVRLPSRSAPIPVIHPAFLQAAHSDEVQRRTKA